eukprot:TRINITY_DN19255_c0_g1_i1.p1 TRINITY_DN19255_c0_g1~~TRINITY_DN19255_c0_g1_i1.p1  ORF type:complete len:502 (+),score=109.93 TRINITY_DN19255_c0_g1_i1:26-1507(+)
MATVDELRVQIASAQGDLQLKRQRRTELIEQHRQAAERQRLRRELDGVHSQVRNAQAEIEFMHNENLEIDADRTGPFPMLQHAKELPALAVRQKGQSSSCKVDYRKAVTKDSFEWTICGFSWLPLAEAQWGGSALARSSFFSVSHEKFCVVYHPYRDQFELCGMDDEADDGARGPIQRGSLAVVHFDEEGLSFRFKVFIKHADGHYVQWGKSQEACYPERNTYKWAFGPDMTYSSMAVPEGIFGLSHEELLHSEWVTDDTLTVKFELEVFSAYEMRSPQKERCIEVSPPCLSENMLSLLKDETYSDVTFVVAGELVKAHSPILAARSEVLGRHLGSGMKESVTKEIVIEDCSAATFRAFLVFLYSDDFAFVEKALKAAEGSRDADACMNNAAQHSGTRTASLQHLLAVSHKYQVSRLLHWCENELCDCISADSVCAMLQQAYLYDAKELESVCLDFIADHMREVSATRGFAELAKDWPALLRKIALYNAGIDC